MTFVEVQEMAYEYMMLHGLTEKGWRFRFNDNKRTYGICKYKNRMIELSQNLVRSRNVAQIRDTILHEIAHALVGSLHAHDRVWQAKAIELGAQPYACARMVVKVDASRGAKLVAQCSCGTPHYRYRKQRNPTTKFYCLKAGKQAGFLEFKPV